MSEGKSINIRIATSGGAQSAAEIRKVETHISGLQAEIDKLSENDFGKENQKQIEALTAKLEQAKEGYRELAAGAEQASGKQEKSGRKSNLAGAAMIGAGIGGAILAKTFGQISEAIDSINVDQLRELDPVMAGQIEKVRELQLLIKEPIQFLLLKATGDTVKSATDSMIEQFALNAKAQEESLDRMIQNGRATAAEIKALAQEIAAANAILDAKDDADSRERDAADAARIRNGDAPEDVRAARAAYDRDKKTEAINRGLEPSAATTQKLFDDARRAVINEERVKADPRANRELIDQAVQESKDARKAADDAKKQYDTAVAVAAEQRRGVRSEFSSAVADAGFDKTQRLESERKRAAAQAAEERTRAEQAAEERTRAEAGLGRSAVSLIPKGATAKARAAVELAAAKLQDGGQGNEVQELLRLVESMAGYIERAGGKNTANAVQIRNLSERIRRLEGK